MKSRIPPDAFDHYVSQGEQRSYQATAKHFGVSKCAVAKCAKREDWVGRLAKIEADARTISDRRVTESLADMQERHSKTLKVMGARVLQALRDCPITDGMDAIRAADMTIKLERLLAGEVSKRTELSIEEITRHEIRTLLKVVAGDEARVVDGTVVAVGKGADDDPGVDEDAAEVERADAV